jgi:hypothetical protein
LAPKAGLNSPASTANSLEGPRPLLIPIWLFEPAERLAVVLSPAELGPISNAPAKFCE